MNCWYCKTQLIWGNDFDIEEEDDHYALLTTLNCPNCEALVETYLPKEKEDERQDQSKLLPS